MKNEEDPIVAEVRRAGDELFKRFNYDLAAVFDYLRRRTDDAARAGRKVVSLPPRRIQPPPASAKKVG